MRTHHRIRCAIGLLALLVAAPTTAWADAPPLVVRGELKDADPLDRVQKQSYAKVHEVELKAGQAMLVELRSIDFDPMLRVEDAKGKVLGQNDDIEPGKNTNSRLGFVAPKAGTYRLVVTSFDPDRAGDYLLEVAALEPVGAPAVMDGELTAKALTMQGMRYQMHKVIAQAGRWHLIDVASKDFGPMLVLRDGKGRVLAEDQGGGEGPNARLVWQFGAGEPWHVQVLAVQPGTGGKFALRLASYQGELKVAATEREKLAEQARFLNARAAEGYGAGQFTDVLAMLRQVLAMRQKLYPVAKYPQGHPDLATSLNNLGELLRSAGQVEAARDYLDQALAMRQKLYRETKYPQGHPELALSLSNLGTLLASAGQYEPAREHYDKALAMRQKNYPETKYPQGHPELALSLHNLGSLLERTGQYEAARAHYDQALAMNRNLYPETDYPQGHPDLAASLSSLGTLLASVGQYEVARAQHNKALAMYRKLYPETKHPQGHPDLAMCLNSLGTLLQLAGQYEPAREHYDQALAMHRKLFPETKYPQGHPELAASLNNLGTLLQSAGQVEPAREHYEKALAMYRKLYPDAKYPSGHPDLAASLSNLGALLRSVGQYEPAREHYEKALAMYRKLYPEAKYPQGHPYLARSLSNLGALLRSAGQYEVARDHLEKALSMIQELYPEAKYPQGHPELAKSLNNLGLLLYSATQHQAARDHLDKALAMYRKLYPETKYPEGHPDLAEILNNLGGLLQAMGESKQAGDLLGQAVAMYNALSLRDVGPAPEAQALDLLRSLPLTRDGYVSVALRIDVAPGKLYAEVWPAKALLSRILQRRHQATRAAQAGDPKVRQAWDNLALVRGELNRLLTIPISDIAVRDKDLARLTARKEKLERDLASLLPELQRARELDKLGPDDLASLLPAGHAFVDFVRYTHFGKGVQRTDKYLAFLVLPGRTIKLIELKEAAPIDRAVHDWRDKINQRTDTPADARAVSALIWEPISQHLPPGTQGLYLAPDSVLTAVPWAALPGRKNGTVLLEDLAIAVVPHGPFLLEQLKNPPQYPAGKESVVGVGAVEYGAAEAPKYDPLPATAAELAKFADLAGKRDVALLQKDEARWDKLKELLPQARYAHLATHGFYDAKALALEQQRLEAQRKDWQFGGTDPARAGQGARSPLAFTGLALAGANLPTKEGSRTGIVTGEALIELPLEGLRLCVLSACETGLVELVPINGEGVQGLPRALHLAGCPNVVSSLWNVNDQATAALMGKLYDGLWREGKTPLAALRQAQLLVYRHPEWIAELAERGPNASKKLAIPLGTQAEKASEARSATKLWAGFVLSGPGR